MKKVFLLGIDGATLDLIEPWARQGRLPHFRRLMEDGCYGTCLSTIHPLTPQAWASFLTGKNPGKHGLYDFGTRKEGTYELRLTSSRDRKASALWHFVNGAGMRAGIINVPLTYPTEAVNGFMIGGMHTPSLQKGVFPNELLNEVTSRFPQYEIDVMSQWYQSYDTFLKNLDQMTKTRMDLAAFLYLKYRPELFFLVLVGADRVQHALWGQMAHPLDMGRKSVWKYSQAVLNTYVQVDEYLERILNALDDDTVLVIMSDHGFGSLEKDVYLNRYLINTGFMKVKDRNWRKPFDMGKPFENIDWNGTKAYSFGLFGNVYVNLRGREPNGIVNTGKDYDQVVNSLVEALQKLKDPADGERIVTQIYKREELYHGPYMEEAPDLLVVMRDYAYITRGGCEFCSEEIVSKPKINHSGNHRINGVCFFYGPGIKRGIRLPDVQIIDLMPTILTIMDIPVPEDVDGRIITDVFENVSRN